MAVYGVVNAARLRLRQSGLFNATTSDLAFGDVASQDILEQTCLALIYPIGSGEGGFGYIFAKTPSASTAGPRFFVDHAAGTPRLGGGAHSTGVASAPNRVAGTSTIAYNAWSLAGMTWDGSITAANIKFFVGAAGAPITEVSSYGASSDGFTAVSVSGNNFHLGNRENTDRTFNGHIAYVARWNRILSIDELRKAQKEGPLSIRRGLVLCWANDRDYGPHAVTPSSRTAIGIGAQPPIQWLGRTITRRNNFSVTAAAARSLIWWNTYGQAANA